MSEREISRIRKKFILISTLSFFGVMLLMGLFISMFCSLTLRNEVRQILEYIVLNDGELPERRGGMTEVPDITVTVSEDTDERDGRVNIDNYELRYILGIGDIFGIAQDYMYTTRYFAVLYDSQGEIEAIKTDHLAFIDSSEAIELARQALGRFFKFGNHKRYYYMVSDRAEGGTIVVYLDRISQIYSIQRIVFSALFLIALGTLLVFFFMRILSKQVVRSEIQNIERQKQFITNAGHELKTPLAIIRANTEMTEMLSGENEWTQSTMRQVDRMNGLIQNLVKVARAQEIDSGMITEMDISPLVTETAESFKPVAIGMGKTLTSSIEENVRIRSEEGSLRQLVSLLVDNAVKYCDDGGTISVGLNRSGKWVYIDIKNTYAAGENADYSRFFERFYREDSARTISSENDGNSGESALKTDNDGAKGGYGIGLSIATGLVKALKGRLDVSWKDGSILFRCRFPGR